MSRPRARNIAGRKNINLARPEPIQGCGALKLVHVAMECARVKAVFGKRLEEDRKHRACDCKRRLRF